MLIKKLLGFAGLAFIFILVIAACMPSISPSVEDASSAPQGALETSVAATVQAIPIEDMVSDMVAATVNAAMNEELWMRQTSVAATLQVEPTYTLYPVATEELTPIVTVLATETGNAVQPTLTPLASNPSLTGGSRLPVVKDYACSVHSQSPKDYTVMVPRQDFDMRWTILNTGTKSWTTSGTDYKYVRGPKMHKYADVFDLPKNVAPGGKIQLVVDMVAPQEKGTHVAYWGLANGSNHFCQFYVIIIVR